MLKNLRSLICLTVAALLLFSGCQGQVTEIDYRKERAKVEFMFDRNSCCTWIAVDDVRHLNPDGEEKA